MQRAVTNAYPNVSILDLCLVIESLDSVFEKVELAVRFIALFTLATGVVVLAGALAAGREQRVREAVWTPVFVTTAAVTMLTIAVGAPT